jgi:hypothetical protein
LKLAASVAQIWDDIKKNPAVISALAASIGVMVAVYFHGRNLAATRLSNSAMMMSDAVARLDSQTMRKHRKDFSGKLKTDQENVDLSKAETPVLDFFAPPDRPRAQGFLRRAKRMVVTISRAMKAAETSVIQLRRFAPAWRVAGSIDLTGGVLPEPAPPPFELMLKLSVQRNQWKARGEYFATNAALDAHRVGRFGENMPFPATRRCWSMYGGFWRRPGPARGAGPPWLEARNAPRTESAASIATIADESASQSEHAQEA